MKMRLSHGLTAQAVLLFALAGAVLADNITWTNTAGGSFQTAGNWSPNKVPGALDEARFFTSYTGTYAVVLNDHVNVTNFNATTGVYAMDLDLNGYTLTSASNGLFHVANSSNDVVDITLRSSLPGGVFNLFRLYWCYSSAGALGRVHITGSNTSVNVTNGSATDNFAFFRSGGEFKVSDGAHFLASKTLIFGIGSYKSYQGVADLSPKATLTVTDPGTTFTNLAGVVVGKAGTNMPTLVVSNGASFIVNSSVNAGQGGDTGESFSPKANGKVIVTGSGSYLKATALYAGDRAGEFGTAGSTAGGYYVVENGGTVECSGSLAFGNGIVQNATYGTATNLFAYGETVVRNPGSWLHVAGNLTFGSAANGALRILDGARVTSGAASILYLSYGTAGNPVLTNQNACGALVMSNANSSANFNKVTCGTVAGYGVLTVADNAQLSVTNGIGSYIKLSNRSTLTVSDAFVQTPDLYVVSNSTLRVEMGARDHASAYLQVNNVTLSAGARLEIGTLANAAHSAGDTITLLKYTGTRIGTFTGLSEGAVILAEGRRFKIYYGDGSNDAVTLKYAPVGTLLKML